MADHPKHTQARHEAAAQNKADQKDMPVSGKPQGETAEVAPTAPAHDGSHSDNSDKPAGKSVPTDTSPGPQRNEVEKVVAEGARATTAKELIDFLLANHTPPAPLEGTQRWAHENADASAEDCYRHMEATAAVDEINLGTLRKAGKFVFGPSFEPDQGVLQAPGQELTKARSEAATLQQRLQQMEADNRSLIKQRDLALEQKEGYRRQVQALSVGKTKKELREAGIEDEEK